MPIYTVQSPSGEVFEMEGPEGATQEQAINMVRQNYGELKRQAYQLQVAERNKPTGEKTTPWEDIKYGVSEAARTFDPLALSVANAFDKNGSQEKAALQAAEIAKQRRKDWGIEDYHRKEAGIGGKITAGVSQMGLTMPLKGGAAVVNAGAQTIGSGINTYNDLRRQGVDQWTAMEVAGILGVSQGVTAALPAAGAASSNVFKAAAGAGVTNSAQNWGTNAMAAKILRSKGYEDIAKMYDYTGEQGVVDAVVGAVGGAAGRVINGKPKDELKNVSPRVRQLDTEQQQARVTPTTGDELSRVNQAGAIRDTMQSDVLGRVNKAQQYRDTLRSDELGNLNQAAKTRQKMSQNEMRFDQLARVNRAPDLRAVNVVERENEQSMSPINPFRVADPEAAAREMSQLQEIHEPTPLHQQAGVLDRYGNEGAIGVVNPRLLQRVLGNEQLPPDVQSRFGTPPDGPTGVVNPRALDRVLGEPQQPPIEFRPGEDQNYGNGSPSLYAPARSGKTTSMEKAIKEADAEANRSVGRKNPFSMERPAPENKEPIPYQDPADIPTASDKNWQEANIPVRRLEIQDPVANRAVTGIMGNDRTPGRTPPRQVAPNQAVERNPLLRGSLEEFEKVDAGTAKERVLSGEYKDISDSRLKQSITPGANVYQALTKNPVVAFLNTVWRDRETDQNSFLEQHITGKTDTIPYWYNKLVKTKSEFVEAMQAMKVADKNGVDITPEQLARFTPTQQGFIKAWKKAFDELYVRHNASNLANGVDSFEARKGYFPSIFDGEYMAVVRNADDKVVQILSGNTKHELNKLIRDYQAANRDHVVDKIEGSSLQGVSVGFRNAQMQKQLLELIGKNDPETAAVIQKYYETVEAVRNHRLFGQDDHELRKSGVPGSAGDKYWKTPEQNAEEMYRAGIRHMEDSIAFSTAQDAFAKLNPFMKDADIVREMPNAVEYAQKYSKSAVGIIGDGLTGHFGHGFNEAISRALNNSFVDRLGLNINRGIKTASAMKTFITWKMMGLGNLSFTEAQLLQPMQTVLPLIRTIASRNGNDTFDMIGSAQRGARAGLMGWYELMSGKRTPMMDDYDRAAFGYMREKGIAIFSEMERLDQSTKTGVAKKAANIAEANMKIGELSTRPTAFMMFARAIKDMAGDQYTDKEIFGIADNMTRMAMIDYSKQEKAMLFKDLGLVGNFAGALQTYKLGNLGLQAYLAKNAYRKKEFQPFAYALLGQAAVSGVTGLWGFEEADQIVRLISKALGHPVTLRDLAYRNLPDWASFGTLSVLQGGNIASKFSAANVLPDGFADISAHGKYIANMAKEVFEAIGNGMHGADINRLLYIMAPESVRPGLAEKLFNSNEDFTLKRNKERGYMENNFQRTPEEWESSMGPLQLRPLREVKESTSLYAGKDREKFYQDKRQEILNNIVNTELNNDWTPNKFDKLKQQYMDYQGTEDEFNRQLNELLGSIKGEGRTNVRVRRQMSERQRVQGDPATVNTPAEIRRYQNYE